MIEEQVRRRALRWFSRPGLLDPDDARDMLAWAQPGAAPAPPACPPSIGASSGFSLDACVCIAGHDRAELERIEQAPARNGEQQVVYRLPKPQRDGRTELSLTPLECRDHLAALVAASRRLVAQETRHSLHPS